jgi:hypothetical protein
MSETDDRKSLFQRLTRNLDYAEKKLYDHKKKDEGMRIRWSNNITKTIAVYGKLMETEELEQRIEKLENQIKDGVLIPGEKR